MNAFIWLKWIPFVALSVVICARLTLVRRFSVKAFVTEAAITCFNLFILVCTKENVEFVPFFFLSVCFC